MAQPMRLSLAITADASGVAPATAEVRREIQGVDAAAREAASGLAIVSAANDRLEATARKAADAARGQSAAEKDLRNAVMQFAGGRAPLNDNEYRRRAADVEAYGDALDRLRARYNPLFAVTRQYLTAREEIRRAHTVGAISSDEMTAALSRERQATLASIAAIKGRNAAITDAPPVMRNVANDNRFGGGGSFATANIAAQFQDIGVTSAMGMSPLQIALQQGTQLSAVLNTMKNPVKGLASAFLSVINPVSLVTIGVVGLAAATIQYFTMSKRETRTIDQLLDDHDETIRALKEAWGEAATGSEQYGQRSSRAVSFAFEMSTAELRKRLREEVANVNAAITEAAGANLDDIGGPRAFRQTELFRVLSEEIGNLLEAAKGGEPDIIGLTRRIEELGQASGNTGIRNLADDVATAIRPIEELARKLVDANRRLKELFDNVGPNGMLLSQGPWARDDMAALADFETQQAIAQQRAREAFDADVMGMRARSPSERAAAARAQAAADYDVDESASDRAQRIELAGMRELISAEHELTEARRDRARALDESVAQQELELQLIGKTAGEAARLRMEFDLTAQLREEAARTGVAVDEQEIELIRRKAAEVGNYADKIAATRLEQDLMFEREQLFRSPAEQRVFSTLRGAGIEPASERGQAIADQIRLNEQIEFGRDLAQDFGNSLVGAFRDGKLEGQELLGIVVQLIQQLATMPGGFSGIGGVLQGIFGGGTTSFASDILSGVRVGLFHDGRYPGQPGGTRLADPAWFINAPRYHNGRIPHLAPDEEPAIVRRNEPIFRDMNHARQVVGAMGGSQQRVGLEVEVFVRDDGTLGAIAREAGRSGGAEAADVQIKQSEASLPERMNQAKRYPRRRGAQA